MKTLTQAAIALFLVLSSLTSCAQTQAYGNSDQARLEQILAPVALYPDTVLSHILIAATYPLEVVQADRWVQHNSGLSGQDAVNAAANQGWDPSVVALVAFPDLLHRMSQDLDWTQELGEYFLADEASIMAAVQNLRERAYAAGTLNQPDHIKVYKENRAIYIEPAVERVVYLPYYDSRVVFGNWWWADYPPVYWLPPAHRGYVNHFYWGRQVTLTPTFFFSTVNWYDHRVVVINPKYRVKHYSGRYIARHDHATHWQHNTHHRRNVVYREPRLRQRFNNGPNWEHNSPKTQRMTDGKKLPAKREFTAERMNQSSSKAAPIRQSANDGERNKPRGSAKEDFKKDPRYSSDGKDQNKPLRYTQQKNTERADDKKMTFRNQQNKITGGAEEKRSSAKQYNSRSDQSDQNVRSSHNDNRNAPEPRPAPREVTQTKVQTYEAPRQQKSEPVKKFERRDEDKPKYKSEYKRNDSDNRRETRSSRDFERQSSNQKTSSFRRVREERTR